MSEEDDGFYTTGFILYNGAAGETLIIYIDGLNISRRYDGALSLDSELRPPRAPFSIRRFGRIPSIASTDSELSPPRAPFSMRRFGQIPSIAFPADEAPAAQCVICLAPFQPGEEVKELLCHHKFHSECLEPWLRERQHCPLCRNAVSVGSISSENGSSWLSDTTGLSHTDSYFFLTAEEFSDAEAFAEALVEAFPQVFPEDPIDWNAENGDTVSMHSQHTVSDTYTIHHTHPSRSATHTNITPSVNIHCDMDSVLSTDTDWSDGTSD
ncbi:hypothetical protein M8J76_002446 [Diaphorina citri]|nr:hypothetical protein M8J76_002446 [Diaphorina citri]KAI5720536.1 hypothetical protein M8J77_008307 [Diaphorina citri]